MAAIWQQLSQEISEAVDQAGKSIVAVDGRSGHTSSGIIWQADFVLTAAHSIRSDSNVRVILGPGKSVQAKPAGKDRGTDVAVLKVDGSIEAPPAQFGTTTSLSVGELVLAVARTRRGNIVASSGIVGGLMGEWQVGRTRIDQFVRPDLTMYPGFSGGGLIGTAGGILGLNTSGLVRGKSITIPSSTLERIANEIVSKGHVAQPYIGLLMYPVQIPDSLQKKANSAAGAGLLVMHVEAGGPADLGGALLGDILIDIDGHALDDLEDLQQELGRKKIGTAVQTNIIRGGQRVQLTIQIGERPVG